MKILFGIPRFRPSFEALGVSKAQRVTGISFQVYCLNHNRISSARQYQQFSSNVSLFRNIDISLDLHLTCERRFFTHTWNSRLNINQVIDMELQPVHDEHNQEFFITLTGNCRNLPSWCVLKSVTERSLNFRSLDYGYHTYLDPKPLGHCTNTILY